MMEAATQASLANEGKNSEATCFIAAHLPLMWMLPTASMLLVCFAPSLGIFIRTAGQPTYSSGISLDDARDIASTIRALGYRLFAGGLTEHLAIQINRVALRDTM